MGEFDWNKGVQSGILSSFFYGYIVMQVPGGWLAGRFGGKRVLGIAMTIVATATVLLPVLARQDYRFVYALRVVMGLASVSTCTFLVFRWGRHPPSKTPVGVLTLTCRSEGPSRETVGRSNLHKWLASRKI